MESQKEIPVDIRMRKAASDGAVVNADNQAGQNELQNAPRRASSTPVMPGAGAAEACLPPRVDIEVLQSGQPPEKPRPFNEVEQGFVRPVQPKQFASAAPRKLFAERYGGAVTESGTAEQQGSGRDSGREQNEKQLSGRISGSGREGNEQQLSGRTSGSGRERNQQQLSGRISGSGRERNQQQLSGRISGSGRERNQQQLSGRSGSGKNRKERLSGRARKSMQLQQAEAEARMGGYVSGSQPKKRQSRNYINTFPRPEMMQKAAAAVGFGPGANIGRFNQPGNVHRGSGQAQQSGPDQESMGVCPETVQLPNPYQQKIPWGPGEPEKAPYQGIKQAGQDQVRIPNRLGEAGAQGGAGPVPEGGRQRRQRARRPGQENYPQGQAPLQFAPIQNKSRDKLVQRSNPDVSRFGPPPVTIASKEQLNTGARGPGTLQKVPYGQEEGQPIEIPNQSGQSPQQSGDRSRMEPMRRTKSTYETLGTPQSPQAVPSPADKDTRTRPFDRSPLPQIVPKQAGKQDGIYRSRSDPRQERNKIDRAKSMVQTYPVGATNENAETPMKAPIGKLVKLGKGQTAAKFDAAKAGKVESKSPAKSPGKRPTKTERTITGELADDEITEVSHSNNSGPLEHAPDHPDKLKGPCFKDDGAYDTVENTLGGLLDNKKAEPPPAKPAPKKEDKLKRIEPRKPAGKAFSAAKLVDGKKKEPDKKKSKKVKSTEVRKTDSKKYRLRPSRSSTHSSRSQSASKKDDLSKTQSLISPVWTFRKSTREPVDQIKKPKPKKVKSKTKVKKKKSDRKLWSSRKKKKTA